MFSNAGPECEHVNNAHISGNATIHFRPKHKNKQQQSRMIFFKARKNEEKNGEKPPPTDSAVNDTEMIN